MLSYISALVVWIIVLAGLILGPDGTQVSLRYFDSVLHFLGGIGLGFLWCGLAGSSLPGMLSRISILFRSMTGAFVFILMCGIIWECFEIYYGISGYPLWTKLYYMDTAKDLVLDVVGGVLIAGLIARKGKQRAVINDAN